MHLNYADTLCVWNSVFVDSLSSYQPCYSSHDNFATLIIYVHVTLANKSFVSFYVSHTSYLFQLLELS